MIEMAEIPKIKKLNYLISFSDKIKRDIDIFDKNKLNILIHYLNYSNYLHQSVNRRIKLIYTYNLKNKTNFDFYDILLFNEIILEIKIYLKLQKFYKNIIFQKWYFFNHLIKYFMIKYLD
jgi:hypothetical protein